MARGSKQCERRGGSREWHTEVLSEATTVSLLDQGRVRILGRGRLWVGEQLSLEGDDHTMEEES
jgi:hypothetical protein